MTEPLERYRTLLDQRQAERDLWSRREFRVSLARLAVMLTIVVVAWLAVQSRVLALGWVLIPVVGFLALVSLHDRLLRRKARAQQACTYYQGAIDRVEERWREAPGEDGSRFRSAQHLYADDLDVLGPASLYHLLNQTRTRTGEETLARWLLAPAEPEEVLGRQHAVRELAGRQPLREELATLGSEVRSELNPERLREWAAADRVLPTAKVWRVLLAILALANVSFLVMWIGGFWTGRPLLASLLLSFAVFLILRGRIGFVVSSMEKTGRDLEVVAETLDLLQAETFESTWLKSRVEELTLDGAAPGQRIRALQTWVQRLESRRNPFFAPFAAMVLWTSQCAFVIEEWRQHWGQRAPRWLDLVGEIESLSCLATFAWERGLDREGASAGVVFPDILGEADGNLDSDFAEGMDEEREGDATTRTLARFEARGLGHPLIDPARCVRNDLELGVAPQTPPHSNPVQAAPSDPTPPPQALIISGSNMSGKSTFLRACGLNVVLAWAGAPVVAHQMVVSPLAVGASIRIQDSLQEGSSKFYAEIQRLRSIIDLTRGSRPVLCLLDEILHGTNSHDRRIGAAAVVRALLERRALVLVTTHDLALARMAESEEFGLDPGRLRNVHFVDTLEGGRIHFDYALREGVVTRSNAIELMREVGLDV